VAEFFQPAYQPDFNGISKHSLAESGLCVAVFTIFAAELFDERRCLVGEAQGNQNESKEAQQGDEPVIGDRSPCREIGRGKCAAPGTACGELILVIIALQSRLVFRPCLIADAQACRR
jgi:hypothetical protein